MDIVGTLAIHLLQNGDLVKNFQVQHQISNNNDKSMWEKGEKGLTKVRANKLFEDILNTSTSKGRNNWKFTLQFS